MLQNNNFEKMVVKVGQMYDNKYLDIISQFLSLQAVSLEYRKHRNGTTSPSVSEFLSSKPFLFALAPSKFLVMFRRFAICLFNSLKVLLLQHELTKI